jgi:hypothetical protein
MVGSAGWLSDRADGLSLSELDSPADGEPLGLGVVLGLVPAARAGWAGCDPAPCSLPGGSGGMAVAGP